jgi:hypothetical protein
VQGRSTRREALGHFIAGTGDPKRLERLHNAVYKLADDGLS